VSANDLPERVSSGIPGLDRMLGGGLWPGRPYLVTGGTGSGKTLVGLSFLREGLARGEQVLLVAVDEPPSEILENVRSFGWDLQRTLTIDANPTSRSIRKTGDIQQIHALGDVRTLEEIVPVKRMVGGPHDDISIQSIHLKLRQTLANVKVSRVLVDSVTSIRRFALKSVADSQADRSEIQSLIRFLTECEATTLMTALPGNPLTLSPEDLLARGEILLTRKWIGDRSVRQVKIVRMRGSAHDPERRPFSISPRGILVG
jgi:KaiC/GvpD/RAD55 family RecA-like ATPase